MPQEGFEPVRQFIFLERPHRSRIGHGSHIVKMHVGVDQTRQDPAFGRVHLCLAPQWFCRYVGDLSAVDADITQSGVRLVPVEHVRAVDHQVIRCGLVSAACRDRLRHASLSSHVV